MVQTIKDNNKRINFIFFASLTNFYKVYQKYSSLINNAVDIIIMGGTKSKGNVKFNLEISLLFK